jgi:hypothetical protein
MGLIDLGNSSIIRLKESLKNLGRSPISIDPIRAKPIRFSI